MLFLLELQLAFPGLLISIIISIRAMEGCLLKDNFLNFRALRGYSGVGREPEMVS